jgi:stage V sporulation protein AF
MAEVTKDVKVSKKIEENIKYLNEKLDFENNFDVIKRPLNYAGKDFTFVFIDGLINDSVVVKMMASFEKLKREDIVPFSLQKFIKEHINYVEVSTEKSMDKILFFVLSGALALVVDGADEIVIIDVREYPGRSPEEPDLERVIRGSRDGFTETVVFNTSLLRRRVRDPGLRVEHMEIGLRSRSDICICYINDIVNQKILKKLKDKLEAIEIDGLPMAEKSVEELIAPGSYWNPFPKVRYTERPDVAAQHLYEGHIIVMVDTSPSVMILPVTYFHHVQHAEEYRQNPTVGVYMRWVRFFGVLISVFALPLWLLLALQPELLPESLKFIGPKKIGSVPLVIQALIAEFGLDLMRMSAIHTPTALATALGLIAAVLIGDIAVSVGLFSPEIILYAAVSAVGVFATPSFELAMANRLLRIFLLLATGFFGLTGFAAAILIILVYLGFTKSFGVPYLWPVIPLNFKALKTILIRSPIAVQNTRLSIVRPKDADRQPSPAMKPLKEKKRK